MLIGIDLDHTIIHYQDLFYLEALSQKWIDFNHPKDKNLIKKTIKKNYSEKSWQLLQSIVYGEKIALAKPYPGIESFSSFIGLSRLVIISHKTERSYANKHDLQKSARNWLNKQSVIKDIPVIFAESLKEKCKIIQEKKCTHFIDDLPEVLELIHPHTQKILFDPEGKKASKDFYKKCRSWDEIYKVIASG